MYQKGYAIASPAWDIWLSSAPSGSMRNKAPPACLQQTTLSLVDWPLILAVETVGLAASLCRKRLFLLICCSTVLSAFSISLLVVHNITAFVGCHCLPNADMHASVSQQWWPYLLFNSLNVCSISISSLPIEDKCSVMLFVMKLLSQFYQL